MLDLMEHSTSSEALRADRPARLLYIQSEGEERRAVADALTRAGFQVTEAGTGLAAIETALDTQPDLVLLDLHLADMEGPEVAARLRSAGLEHTPIVAIGRARIQRGLALSVGCDGAVASPPNLATLPAELREFLAGKRERLRTGEEKKYLREFSQSLVEKLESKIRDVTAVNERLRDADRFKNEFMTAISHELSTPLTPIVGYLKLLHVARLGPLDDRQKKAVEAMLHSADRLAHTIDNLSDFAALDTGDYRIRAGPIDPVTLAREVVDTLHDAAKVKRVTVRVEAPATVPPVVADGQRLRQALLNMVDNAVRFSPHGGHVLVQVDADAERLRILVLDQGPGVPLAEHQRIFEPFHRSPRGSTPQAIVSTGLGLPVTRKILEAHMGRIWVESPPKSPPEGTVRYSGALFGIEMPVQPRFT